jgi:hypothetical protein
MDPVFWGKILQLALRYWYVIVIGLLVVVVGVERKQVTNRNHSIEELNKSLALKDRDIKDLNTKLDAQAKAVALMEQKGKEQAARLDVAIKQVNEMKAATQVIIRGIYTDKAKTVDDLLYNALLD